MKLTKIYNAIETLLDKDCPNDDHIDALRFLLDHIGNIGAILYAAEGLDDPSDQLGPARNVTHYVERLAAALEGK